MEVTVFPLRKSFPPSLVFPLSWAFFKVFKILYSNRIGEVCTDMKFPCKLRYSLQELPSPKYWPSPPGPLNQTVPLLLLLPPSLSLKNWVQGKPVSIST